MSKTITIKANRIVLRGQNGAANLTTISS